MHSNHSVCGYEHSAEQNNPVNCFARGLIRVEFRPCFFNANFAKNKINFYYTSWQIPENMLILLCKLICRNEVLAYFGQGLGWCWNEVYMKKFLFCLIGVVVVGGSIWAYNIYNNSTDQCLAGRGCCSSHGGVCGCQNGRSKCCDGTLSPSCHCFRDDVKGIGM